MGSSRGPVPQPLAGALLKTPKAGDKGQYGALDRGAKRFSPRSLSAKMQVENTQQEKPGQEQGQWMLGTFQKEGILSGSFLKYWMWGKHCGLSSGFLELFRGKSRLIASSGFLPSLLLPLPFTEVPALECLFRANLL